MKKITLGLKKAKRWSSLKMHAALLVSSSIFITPIVAQQNVITEVWENPNGLQSGIFGAPTIIASSGNIYRAGFEKQPAGGTDVRLQELNEGGDIMWDIMLNTSSSPNERYEPTKLVEGNGDIYVTGIVTYMSSGETDFFVAKVASGGTIEWFTIDQTTGNDIAADLFYDSGNDGVYICGTTQRAGAGYDVLLTFYDGGGNQAWVNTMDYNGNADLGAIVYRNGVDIMIHGSSQQSAIDWDIVSWQFDDSGNYLGEERSSGFSQESEELKDGILNNGHISLAGFTTLGSDRDLKVLCLDANNNILWQDTYDKIGLDDEGTALVATANGFVVTGYVTGTSGNENILVRKYDLTGSVLWTQEIDVEGQNDRGIDIIENVDGDVMILSDVTVDGQKDVYLHLLEGVSGATIWGQMVSENFSIDEHALSLEANINGEITLTYSVGSQTTTEVYSYTEVDFPTDNESFSRGSLIIANSGQIKDGNDVSAEGIRYYTFGSYPDMYFADERMSAIISNSTTDQVQRIDFDFVGANTTHVGQLVEYEKETHFNYYQGTEKYELQGTFDVLAYPALYNGIDAFISSNSSGFKMVLVLENGADLSDIEIDINGASGIALNANDLEVSTISDPINWLNPFSYHRYAGEIVDDDCIEYTISNGHLKLENHCGELSYPYVVQLKAGVGASYGVTSIGNMEWGTFWGGSTNDVGSDMEVDAAGNIYIGGMVSSNAGWKSGAGITNGQTKGNRHGVALKFNYDGGVEWATLLSASETNQAAFVRGIGLYDNNSHPANTGQEVHVVGEYTGVFAPLIAANSGVPTGAWYQASYSQSNDANGHPKRDLFFATLTNDNGTLLIKSPFGGDETEMIFAMDIDVNGVMYFGGSTKGQTSQTSSQIPLSNNNKFPVRNPGDGSYYNDVHPSVGSERGFISAIDLNTYKLVYSSIITKDQGSTTSDDYKAIYSITTDGGGAFCGESTTSYGRIGFFNSSSQKFASTLSQNLSEWQSKQYFCSVVHTDNGYVFVGHKKSGNTLLSSSGQDKYRSTGGNAYLMRISGGAVQWDTFFGKDGTSPNANLSNWKNNLIDDPFIPNFVSTGAFGGRGKLAYNNATSSLYLAGSLYNADSETMSVPGFFNQSQIATTVYSGQPTELFLATFSSNGWGTTDKFTWGTLYGSGQRQEHLNDVVTYDKNGETYMVTLSTTNARSGSTTSDIDEFPLSSATNAWYQDYNPGKQIGYFLLGINKFKVTNIKNHVSLKNEFLVGNDPWEIYPNPSQGIFEVISYKGDAIEKMEVYDIHGRCLLSQVGPWGTRMALDLTSLSSGMYVVHINDSYSQKVIKQ